MAARRNRWADAGMRRCVAPTQAPAQVPVSHVQLSPQRHCGPQAQFACVGADWQPHWQAAPAQAVQSQGDSLDVFMMTFLSVK